MKDNRLIRLRYRAELDKKLSHSAFRVLCCLISEKWHEPHFQPDGGEFDLTWKKVQSLTGHEEDQAYRLLKHLCDLRYIKTTGVFGSPPKRFFQFCLPKPRPSDNYREAPKTSKRQPMPIEELQENWSKAKKAAFTWD